jgi:hypothetical protein
MADAPEEGVSLVGTPGLDREHWRHRRGFARELAGQRHVEGGFGERRGSGGST